MLSSKLFIEDFLSSDAIVAFTLRDCVLSYLTSISTQQTPRKLRSGLPRCQDIIFRLYQIRLSVFFDALSLIELRFTSTTSMFHAQITRHPSVASQQPSINAPFSHYSTATDCALVTRRSTYPFAFGLEPHPIMIPPVEENALFSICRSQTYLLPCCEVQ